MKGRRWSQQAAAQMGGTKKEPVKMNTARAHDRGYYMDHNHKEDSMIDAIDMKRQLEKLAPIFQKLDQGHYDVAQAVSAISGPALKELIMVAFSGESEKNKLDAVKHLLGLGGHVPIQKHAVASVDPTQSKEALKALIAGASSDLAEEGIEIIDDRETED